MYYQTTNPVHVHLLLIYGTEWMHCIGLKELMIVLLFTLALFTAPAMKVMCLWEC